MEADWRRTTVGAVARQRTEKVLPARADSTPYVALENISSGTGQLLRVGASGTAQSHKTRFVAGDTLFGKLRPNLRKVARANFDGVCSTDIIAVGTRAGADTQYLYHLLSSEGVYHHVMGDITGTKMPRTSWQRLSSFSFLCPPLIEQRAIAALLDAIDGAIERTEIAVTATKTLLNALLHELLARGVPGWHSAWKHTPGLGSIPACWGSTTVGAVSEHVTKGATPTTFGHKWTEAGPVFLRSECVGEGVLLPAAGMHITQVAHDGMRRSHVRDGDILMTITGYIGRVCRVPDGFGEASINQHIARIRVLPDRATNLHFAYWALISPRTRRALRDQVTGIAYPQIGLAEVRSIVLPVPPPNEQLAIAAALEGAAARVAAEAGSITCLRLLKQATAGVLLTGRLRIAGTLRPRSVVA